MPQLKVGIIGCGGIGLAYAAWIAQAGHGVTIWSPRGSADQLRHQPLSASGVLDVTLSVACVDSAKELAASSDVVLIAVPVNGHRKIMDELLPHLSSRHMVIVSSMSSLSSLYLFEAAHSRSLDLRVASFGTTVMTARRNHAASVNIMTKRATVPVSCLPLCDLPDVLEVCKTLFGDVFTAEENPLVTTLSNGNPISHVPLALLNWTRIERSENWPQFHYMTPHVSMVIENLDAERAAVAKAFGISVASVSRHLKRSFNLGELDLAGIASELHKRRGGPPGPVDVATRYISEDVPFGLVFLKALGGVADVPVPLTTALIDLASSVVGEDFNASNDLILALDLPSESKDGLMARARGGVFARGAERSQGNGWTARA